jgi:hypothetical protein
VVQSTFAYITADRLQRAIEEFDHEAKEQAQPPPRPTPQANGRGASDAEGGAASEAETSEGGPC